MNKNFEFQYAVSIESFYMLESFRNNGDIYIFSFLLPLSLFHSICTFLRSISFCHRLSFLPRNPVSFSLWLQWTSIWLFWQVVRRQFWHRGNDLLPWKCRGKKDYKSKTSTFCCRHQKSKWRSTELWCNSGKQIWLLRSSSHVFHKSWIYDFSVTLRSL